MRQITYKEILDVDIDNEVVVSKINGKFKKAMPYEKGVKKFTPWMKELVCQVARYKLIVTPGSTLWVGRLNPVDTSDGIILSTEDTLWYKSLEDSRYFLPITLRQALDKLRDNPQLVLYEVK